MNSVLSSVHSLMQMFEVKTREFFNEIDNVHILWLEEIQQEANRMFSRWTRSNMTPNVFISCQTLTSRAAKKSVVLFSFSKFKVLLIHSVYFRDFNVEPELMPKTPSQKRNTRRKRVSLGRQEENQARRRFVAFINVTVETKFSKFLRNPETV